MLIVTGVAYLFREPLGGDWFIVLPKENNERIIIGCKAYAREQIRLLGEDGDISEEEVISLNQQVNDSDMPETWRDPSEAAAFVARAISHVTKEVLEWYYERRQTLH